ncbi:hypothetical protein T06_9457 [Trichinella sp. T6]|nr:hypothetical protein T06_9457 [Trichinella sp. T6]
MPPVPRSQEFTRDPFLKDGRQLPWYVSESIAISSRKRFCFPSRIALLVAAGTAKCSRAESSGFRRVVVSATTLETQSMLVIMLLAPTATRAMCCVVRGRNPSPPCLMGMDKNMLFMPVVGKCRKRFTVDLITPSTLSKIFLEIPGTPSPYSSDEIR